MDKRSRMLIATAAIIGVPVVGASIMLIGNNTGTAAQRCDRFWMSKAASTECHQRLADAEADRDMAQSADLQRQIDENQRRIDATQRNIDAADRALVDLQAARP